MRDLFLKYLERQGWNYDIPNKENEIIVFGIDIEGGKFRCGLKVDTINKRTIFYTFYPLIIPKHFEITVLYAANMINARLFYGNFELEPQNNELRFRTSLPLPANSDLLDDMWISFLLKHNIMSMGLHLSIFNQLLSKEIKVDDIPKILHATYSQIGAQ